MSCFLFVVPPLTGHVTPLVAVARELRSRGHAVVWCGDRPLIHSLAGPGAVVHECPGPASGLEPGAGLRGYAAVRFLWEDLLVPLADSTVDAVADAAVRYRADVVVSDMQAFAGPLAAARLNLPWATSASTSAPLRDSFAAAPKVRSWLDGLLDGLIRRHLAGTSRMTPAELELSPHLAIAFATEALAGPAPAQVRYVGPVLGPRPQHGPPFPVHRLDGRPLVVVTLGTVSAAVGAPFLRACADAVRLLGGRLQAAIADPAGALGTSPAPEIITAPYLPMLELLGRATAVVCHGGHNTVCESLAHGVPLVVAPIRDDQPVIAAQVADAGAGVRVRFPHATPEVLRDAITAVVSEPRYRASAQAVRSSFDSAGGAAAAADHLLALAAAALPATP
jgi:UDP:flavonoid glycosyltransferase YjiC (YdhE family)